MSPAEFLNTAQSIGVTLWNESGVLRYRGPREAVERVVPVLKAHKAVILKALAQALPDLLSRDWSAMPTPVLLRAARNAGMRISVADNGDGRMVLYDVETGGPAGLWDEIQSRAGEILAASPEEADMAQTVQAVEQMAREAEDLDLPGVSPEFAARLSAEDRADIAAGDISVDQVQAFETAAIAREARDLRVILEHDAGLSRPEAELEAARLAVAYARNRGYLWASLRAALADYPILLSQVPDRPGKVDGLALGLATAHVRKDGRVLKQGEFAGAMEVRI
jgi:hypothetical protein